MPNTNQLYQSALTGAGSRADALDTGAADALAYYRQLLGGGQDALNTSARAAVDSAMPQFYGALQGVRESALRRGVSNGDLGTSYEGDVASAFQRNLSNAIAGQSLGMYGQQLGAAGSLYGMQANRADNTRTNYYDLLTGQRDYETAQANARKRRRSGLWGGIGSALGAIGGGLVGGPAGAATGAQIGGSVGSGIGGY